MVSVPSNDTPALAIFPAPELPLGLKHQLLAAVRIEWWWVFQDDQVHWDYTNKPTQPRYVVLTTGEVLLSFAEINRRTLIDAGTTYTVDGVSAVYTFPAVRRQGYSGKVIAAATSAIDRGDADLALLFCLPVLVPFYARAGWMRCERQIVAGPDDAKTLITDEVALARPRTSSGRTLIQPTEAPLDIGRYTW
jgi:hypothetical protein